MLNSNDIAAQLIFKKVVELTHPLQKLNKGIYLDDSDALPARATLDGQTDHKTYDFTRIFGENWELVPFPAMTYQNSYRVMVQSIQEYVPGVLLNLIAGEIRVLDNSAQARHALAYALVMTGGSLVAKVSQALSADVEAQKAVIARDYGFLMIDLDDPNIKGSIRFYIDPPLLQKEAEAYGMPYRNSIQFVRKVLERRLIEEAKKYGLYDAHEPQKISDLLPLVIARRLEQVIEKCLNHFVDKNSKGGSLLFTQTKAINDVLMRMKSDQKDQYIDSKKLAQEVISSIKEIHGIDVTKSYGKHFTDDMLVARMQTESDVLYSTIVLGCADREKQMLLYTYEMTFGEIRKSPFKAELKRGADYADTFEMLSQKDKTKDPGFFKESAIALDIAICDARIRFFEQYKNNLKALPAHFKTKTVDVACESMDLLVKYAKQIENQLLQSIFDLGDPESVKELKALQDKVQHCFDILGKIKVIHDLSELSMKDKEQKKETVESRWVSAEQLLKQVGVNPNELHGGGGSLFMLHQDVVMPASGASASSSASSSSAASGRDRSHSNSNNNNNK